MTTLADLTGAAAEGARALRFHGRIQMAAHDDQGPHGDWPPRDQDSRDIQNELSTPLGGAAAWIVVPGPSSPLVTSA